MDNNAFVILQVLHQLSGLADGISSAQTYPYNLKDKLTIVSGSLEDPYTFLNSSACIACIVGRRYRGEDCYVDAKRLVCELPGLADRLAKCFGIWLSQSRQNPYKPVNN